MADKKALTPRQLKTIPYLLKAPKVEDGCRRARVSKATASHWLEDESFRKELSRQRELMMTIALGSLGASVVKAGAVLSELLASPKDNIKLKAAETILRLARRATVIDRANDRAEQPQGNGSGDDDEDPDSDFTPHQLEQMDKVEKMLSDPNFVRPTWK